MALWKLFRDQGERGSGVGLKPFGFVAESVFTIIPESCSGSSWNSVRNHPGIAFTLDRIPHPGPFAVRTHTFEALDPARDRLFPCDIWCPEEPDPWPLVLYSHHSRGNRRAATYLTTHLASHGYLVAALDHSEVVAPEIAANVEGFIANRVPDVRFLLDYMLAGAIPCTARPDPDRIAVVGHSAGG